MARICILLVVLLLLGSCGASGLPQRSAEPVTLEGNFRLEVSFGHTGFQNALIIPVGPHQGLWIVRGPQLDTLRALATARGGRVNVRVTGMRGPSHTPDDAASASDVEHPSGELPSETISVERFEEIDDLPPPTPPSTLED